MSRELDDQTNGHAVVAQNVSTHVVKPSTAVCHGYMTFIVPSLYRKHVFPGCKLNLLAGWQDMLLTSTERWLEMRLMRSAARAAASSGATRS